MCLRMEDYKTKPKDIAWKVAIRKNLSSGKIYSSCCMDSHIDTENILSSPYIPYSQYHAFHLLRTRELARKFKKYWGKGYTGHKLVTLIILKCKIEKKDVICTGFESPYDAEEYKIPDGTEENDVYTTIAVSKYNVIGESR